MGIMKGGLTVRRYRAVGEVPETFRQDYEEALQKNAFHEPRSVVHGEEVEGWVLVQNLLDTDFSLREKWLMNQYIVAGLRVDKRTVPANLFRAHLEKRLEAWCRENNRQKAPATVKGDLREALQTEFLMKTLPRVSVFEFCWSLADGWVLFSNTSDIANDRFRKRFRKTFGLELVPSTPLDFLSGRPDLAERLEIVGVSDTRAAADS
jgi:DNA recombination-dependent growth factor C